jgi:hypothetical protein
VEGDDLADVRCGPASLEMVVDWSMGSSRVSADLLQFKILQISPRSAQWIF